VPLAAVKALVRSRGWRELPTAGEWEVFAFAWPLDHPVDVRVVCYRSATWDDAAGDRNVTTVVPQFPLGIALEGRPQVLRDGLEDALFDAKSDQVRPRRPGGGSVGEGEKHASRREDEDQASPYWRERKGR